MTVPVHRDLDRAVSEVYLDRLRVSTLRDQQRGTGVSQVMEADLLGQAGAAQRWAEKALIEVVVSQLAALRGGEYKRVAVARPVGQVGGQLVPQKLGQADGALCVGLGRPQDQPAADLACGLDDPDRAA